MDKYEIEELREECIKAIQDAERHLKEKRCFAIVGGGPVLGWDGGKICFKGSPLTDSDPGAIFAEILNVPALINTALEAGSKQADGVKAAVKEIWSIVPQVVRPVPSKEKKDQRA